MQKILIVDDEPQIRRQVQTGLKSYGYQVITAINGDHAILIVAQESPDVVILDINLGEGIDGLTVCRRLREWSSVPVIMLSVKSDERVKVTSLDAGADDYLTKPFGMEELRARIQAVLRRTGTENTNTPSEVSAGELRIDMANRRVYVAGEEIHLTPKEYDLLRLLALHSGKVITHRQILHEVWHEDKADSHHYVRVFVNQLRKKLRENPARNIRYILNEPGVGYRFIDLEGNS